MNKKLVCYFSASGNTKSVAENIANALECDLFEIEPEEKYTKEDLNWMNKNSRSSVEMNDLSSRPKVARKVENIDDYDTLFIGYPIWWYTCPTIINTFIEENNLDNKNVYLFATSGSSSADKSLTDLKNSYPNINFIKVKRFKGKESSDEILEWVK